MSFNDIMLEGGQFPYRVMLTYAG